METPTPATPVASTPEPAAPASTPNPAPVDATPANPQPGTGGAQPLRNEPNHTPAVPEGYIPTDKFNASRDEVLRVNEILKKHGIDPKTGERVAATPSTPTPTQPNTPTPPMSVEQAVAQIPGFSALSDQEKAIILNPRQAYRDITEMRNMVAEMYDERETNKQIKELTSKDGYQDIDKEAFREFIYREENLGVKNLETLAKMFKSEQDGKPTPKPLPEGGEPTTAGAKEIATGAGVSELSAADAAQLRREDPKRYAQLIRTKKLRIV